MDKAACKFEFYKPSEPGVINKLESLQYSKLAGYGWIQNKHLKIWGKMATILCLLL